ncbi:Dehydroquinate synthase-like protein [Choiromyces venosus 120613-1]|uniref:3-phosphoshikimate 1-carboxyvinyltransferase n=1 Tax=Choiromyces venosus 120613-1 TaxID=1336337 RepID=A0A3N4J2Z1_9PEZI|nr:Dehydroquinate synthase-like protein [Choiromyces venosus 120613-1]
MSSDSSSAVTTEILGKDTINVGYDLTNSITAGILQYLTSSTYVLITDTNLAPLYLPTFESSFNKNAPQYSPEARLLSHTIPPGEYSKSRTTKAAVEDWILSEKCTCDTVVIALGVVPTMLLAMVDSLIGWKAVIGLPHGKNLIGAFWQPERVFIDMKFLETLPEREFINGMAEVVKTTAIGDEPEFSRLEQNAELIPETVKAKSSDSGRGQIGNVQNVFKDVILGSLRVKAYVVSPDERKGGLRNLLNFGHSIGHGNEVIIFPKMLHGERVATGMIKEAELARLLGVCKLGAVARLSKCLTSYGLPTSLEDKHVKKLTGGKHCEVERMLVIMGVHKKNDGRKKKVVLLAAISRTHEKKASVVNDDSIRVILSLSLIVHSQRSAVPELQVTPPSSKSISNRVLLYIDMTVAMMTAFGIEVTKSTTDEYTYHIPQSSYKNPAEYVVESDAGSTTYPLAIVTMTGSTVTALNIGKTSLQGDARFAEDVLRPIGCTVEQSDYSTTVRGPPRGQLKPLPHVDMERMIDAFLTASVLAAVTNGSERTSITSIVNQRVKECNRIAAMVHKLGKFGITAGELEDDIWIQGIDYNSLKTPEGGVHCYDDHRVAMSFSVLALIAPESNVARRNILFYRGNCRPCHGIPQHGQNQAYACGEYGRCLESSQIWPDCIPCDYLLVDTTDSNGVATVAFGKTQLPISQDQGRALELYIAALTMGLESIDLEITWPRVTSSKGYSKIIASHNDVGGDLPWCNAFWISKFNSTLKYGQAKSIQDNYDLQNFRKCAVTYETRMAVLNIGEKGKISRILNSFLTPVTHPGLPFKAAQGQLSIAEILQALSLIGMLQAKMFYIFRTPIPHSRSPALHNTLFPFPWLAIYLPPVESTDVSTTQEILNSDDFGGASVTIPHKVSIIPLLSSISAQAQVIGAVNTVIPVIAEDGTRKLVGDNFDWCGIQNSPRIGGVTEQENPSAATALIIGTGGTSLAVVYALHKIGYGKIDVVNSTPENLKSLVESFSKENNLVAINSFAEAKSMDLKPITAVSTVPADKPVDDALKVILQKLPTRGASAKVLAEIAYKPRVTEVMNSAEGAGWKVVPGLEALAGQGVGQFKVFFTGGIVPDYGVARAAVPGE